MINIINNSLHCDVTALLLLSSTLLLAFFWPIYHQLLVAVIKMLNKTFSFDLETEQNRKKTNTIVCVSFLCCFSF